MTPKSIRTLGLLLAIGLAAAPFVGVSWASYTKADQEIERIDPAEARQLLESGKALLVCAYGDNACSSILFEGALKKSEFEARVASLPKDQHIIFYCQ